MTKPIVSFTPQAQPQKRMLVVGHGGYLRLYFVPLEYGKSDAIRDGRAHSEDVVKFSSARPGRPQTKTKELRK